MKLKQVVSLTSALALFAGQAGSAFAQAKAERWFEMEVILFSQLDDKSKLKEVFPDAVPLPNYRRVIDLLTPYLNPEIASLKQQLPGCANPVYPDDYVTQAGQASPFYSGKSLEEIAASAAPFGFLDDDLTDANALTDTNALTNDNALDPEGLAQTDSLQLAESESEFSASESKLQDEPALELAQQEFQPVNEFVPSITDEEVALVARAEQEFSHFQFPYHLQPHYQHETLCTLPQEAFSDIQQQDGDFDYHGFPVAQVPRRINAVEDVYSTSPYLLSADSLKLHDIVKQLRRSKNFRPLLHIGWRQAPKDRNKAVPVRLFAGDNFALNYQNAMQDYQDSLAESQAQEQALEQLLTPRAAEPVSGGQQTTEAGSNQEDTAEQILQERINQVLAQIDQIPEDTQAIVAELDAATLALPEPEQDLLLAEAPVAAPQPWYIDGMFRVHLNHYLYITADFNILNMNLAEYATQLLQPEQSVELKPIRFQQNRRVISGEIHYFDHPYMGMIVQIRRHKRPEPEQVPASE